MLKIRTISIITVNILLFFLSWLSHEAPRGDEYLFLFMISLVFIVVPFVLSLKSAAFLFAVNLVFFIVYLNHGILNPIDAFIILSLLVIASGASFMVKKLYRDFNSYYELDINAVEKKYNTIVNELDSVDRRGRKIENELNRMSRLYELTKQLAPALRVEELFDALFNFLIENFKFQCIHFLTFTDGEFSKGISRDTSDADFFCDSNNIPDYEGLVKYCKDKDIKQFFIGKEDKGKDLDRLKIRTDTFMAFSIFEGERISAIVAIEGAAKSSYGRFRILIPQIGLEFRKVELYEQVQRLSIIDSLTGVYLRRYLMERLTEEVDRAHRLGLTFSLGMVDVDHFKQCNDKYGHLVGDAVLKKISEKLKKSVREVDMISRYGGEEFCIVLPETNKELAMTVAERLRKSISEKTIKAFDEEVSTTVSVGVATFPEDGTTLEALIEKADTALYKAKRKGRNMVCSA